MSVSTSFADLSNDADWNGEVFVGLLIMKSEVSTISIKYSSTDPCCEWLANTNIPKSFHVPTSLPNLFDRESNCSSLSVHFGNQT